MQVKLSSLYENNPANAVELKRQDLAISQYIFENVTLGFLVTDTNDEHKEITTRVKAENRTFAAISSHTKVCR